MGLETPLALLGLATVLLPILVHRLQRRDLIPVPLPTFALLSRAQSRKRRSRGLADWLLLALRIAILALATIGLGAPYVTARLSFGDGAVASVAVVIDDSMSMTRQSGPLTQLGRAVERAREALRSLPPGSEVSIVLAGAPARVVLPRTDDAHTAERALDRIDETSLRATELDAAFDLALAELAGARHEARRLLVLSDFATHATLDPDKLSPPGIEVILERMGGDEAETNVFFTSVSALPDPTTEGQTSIALELGAVGEPPPSVPVAVVASGREVARVDVALVEGKGRASVHVPTPRPHSDPTAQLTIDTHDALDADNVAGVLLSRSNALHVMLVNGDPHPATPDDELRYALHALRLSPAGAVPLATRSIDASAFENHDLSQVDVVVMANVDAPGKRIAERLATFVKAGGGLVIAAGDRVRPRVYNERLAGLMPARLRAASRAKDVKLRQPTSPAMFPYGLAGLAEARTRRRLIVESEREVVMAFEDGSAALVSSTHGTGRVLLLTTTLDDDWTDLPLRPGYLPLLSTLIRAAAPGALVSTVEEARGGDQVTLPVPPGATRVEVITPEGAHQAIEIEPGQASVEFSATRSAGPYRVLSASAGGTLTDAPRGAFVVVSPLADSDLRPAPIDEHEQRARNAGLTEVRRSVTSPFFLLCALLILAEGLLRLSRR